MISALRSFVAAAGVGEVAEGERVVALLQFPVKLALRRPDDLLSGPRGIDFVGFLCIAHFDRR